MRFKLKNIVLLLFFIQSFLLMSVLLPAGWYYNKTLSEMDSIKTNLHQMHTLILESEYPLRALINISRLPDDRKAKLDITGPFYSRLSEQQATVKRFSLLYDAVYSSVESLSIGLGQWDQGIGGGYHELMEPLALLRKQFPRRIDEFSILEETKSFEVLLKAQQVSNLSVVQIEDTHNILVDDFLQWSQRLFLIIFAVVIIISLIEAFLIFRIMRFERLFFSALIDMLNSRKTNSPIQAEAVLHQTESLFDEEFKLYRRLSEYLELQNFIREVEESIETEYEMDQLLHTLFEKMQPMVSHDRIGVAFVDWSKKTIRAEYGVTNYGETFLGPGYEVEFSKTSLSEFLDYPRSIITTDMEALYALKPSSRSLGLIIQEGIQSNMMVPIVIHQRAYGFIFFSSKEKEHFSKSELLVAEHIVQRLSSVLIRSYMIKLLFNQMIDSFSRLVDNKDLETGNHLHRMSQYSKILTSTLLKMNLPTHAVDRAFVQNMEIYSKAHDIGKVAVPDSILKKPAKLTPEEFKVIQQHPCVGASLFNDIIDHLSLFEGDYFSIAHDITMYHHEKWDGTGYPIGLKEYDIPLSARIVAVADVFDALCSKRVYKEAMSLETAIGIILEGRGTHFDPTVIDAFLIALDELLRVGESEAGYMKSEQREETP